ncbi:MAG: CAP domain-containing protein [Anaerolineaceae bacterium]
MRRKWLSLVLLATLAFSLGFLHTTSVRASAGSAYDLINAVNGYRQANNLKAYSVDSNLMALAQAHSDWMAANGCSHNNPSSQGIAAENIACGPDLSVEGAVYSQWSDQLHMSTMLGPAEGYVGAGVTVVDGYVYYTLDVTNTKGNFNMVQATLPGGTPAPTPVPIEALSTVTANPDGSIIHVVKYGQALITIAQAYGVTVEEIRALNGMGPTDNSIYVGQKLYIRAAYTPTPSPTITQTSPPPTRTPTMTRTPVTPTVTRTPTLSPTPTSRVLINLPMLKQPGGGRRLAGYAVIAISAIGLLAIALTSLLPRKK